MVDVKIKLINPNCKPVYSTPDSAGMDCFANITDTVIVDPNETVVIPLGFATELPEGWYADVRPRSGLAMKNGISIINSPGLIDRDFIDEWKVLIHNYSNHFFEVKPLMRICQIMIKKYPKVNFIEVKELTKPKVEHKGLGSTGVSK